MIRLPHTITRSTPSPASKTPLSFSAYCCLNGVNSCPLARSSSRSSSTCVPSCPGKTPSLPATQSGTSISRSRTGKLPSAFSLLMITPAYLKLLTKARKNCCSFATTLPSSIRIVCPAIWAASLLCVTMTIVCPSSR